LGIPALFLAGYLSEQPSGQAYTEPEDWCVDHLGAVFSVRRELLRFAVSQIKREFGLISKRKMS
jgi:hypothetical protein